MSVLIIRNDDNCDVYNRTVVILYTKMCSLALWDYVSQRELLADDRQKLFFKIDLDINSAPKTMPNLKDWRILTIVLKAHRRPFSFGILVKLFFEKFPHKLMVDYSNLNIFICSGSYENEGRSMSVSESHAFMALSTWHKQLQTDVLELCNLFTDNVKDVNEAPMVLVELANKYNLKGGSWIMFFNRLDCSRWEKAFNTLFAVSLDKWGTLCRFNAKISSDTLIVCFGNETTLAASDPSILDPAQQKDVDDDPEPLEVLNIIDEIYTPNIFGIMGLKYKPDIVSACCIQRDNLIRPTVYQANYGEYSRSFHPLQQGTMTSNAAGGSSTSNGGRPCRKM